MQFSFSRWKQWRLSEPNEKPSDPLRKGFPYCKPLLCCQQECSALFWCVQCLGEIVQLSWEPQKKMWWKQQRFWSHKWRENHLSLGETFSPYGRHGCVPLRWVMTQGEAPGEPSTSPQRARQDPPAEDCSSWFILVPGESPVVWPSGTLAGAKITQINSKDTVEE